MEVEPEDPTYSSRAPADASEIKLTGLGKQEELFDEEVLGILIHEFGHLAATALQLEHHRSAPTDTDKTPDELQMEADLIMVKKLELRSFTYNNRDIQCVDLDEFESREIGYGV